MNIQSIAAIGIRIFSITLFIQAWQSSSYLFEVLFGRPEEDLAASITVLLLMTAAPLFFGLLFWFYPSIISKILIKREIDTDISPANPIQLLTCILIGLGLYILSYSISDLFYYLTMIHFSDNNSEGPFTLLNIENKSLFIISVFEVLVGLFFLFKAKSFASALLINTK